MRYLAFSLVVCLTASAWAGGEIVEPGASAETSAQLTFDCEGGSNIVATYYFKPGRLTPIRVSATFNGKARELMRDKDDASGWGFGDTEVWVQVGGASLYRDATTLPCKLRDAPPGGGVPAAVANQQSTPAVAPPPTTVVVPRLTDVVPTPTVAPPAAQAPSGVFVICRADSSPGQPHFYNPPVDGNGGSYATWQPAYQRYLVEKYHFKGSGTGCAKYSTAAAAQVDFDQWVANAQHDSTIPGTNFTVVVTDWKGS